MFRSASSFRIALAAGMFSLAAPLMGAGPEVKFELGRASFGPPRLGNFRIRIGAPHKPDFRQPERHNDFVMPCELELSAFQSGNTVIVVAKGANHQSGYITRFEACDLSDRTPEVHLLNTRGHGPCAQGLTSFEATGSFTSRRQISCIKVHIGNECRDVRVVQAPCL